VVCPDSQADERHAASEACLPAGTFLPSWKFPPYAPYTPAPQASRAGPASACCTGSPAKKCWNPATAP